MFGSRSSVGNWCGRVAASPNYLFLPIQLPIPNLIPNPILHCSRSSLQLTA